MKQTSLDPAFSANNVAVFYQINDLYAPYCGVSLLSLLSHASACYNYDIIILSPDMSERSKKLLEGLVCGASNVSLRFFDPCEIMAPWRDKFPTSSFDKLPPEIICSYFFAAGIFSGYEKVIRLGADTLLMEDIATLYNTDIGDNWIGAVRDMWFSLWLSDVDRSKHYERKFGLDHASMVKTHINADVQVLNLTEWRKNNVVEKLLTAGADSTKGEWQLVEQDVINFVCYGHIHYFGWEWNVITNHTLDEDSSKPAEEVKEIEKAFAQPHIVHYAGPKPWNYPDLQLADAWWDYARKTRFYEMLLCRMSVFRNKKALEADATLRELKFHKIRRLSKRGKKYRRISWLPFGIGKSAKKKLAKIEADMRKIREEL